MQMKRKITYQRKNDIISNMMILEDIEFSIGEPKPFDVYVTNDKSFISKYMNEMFSLICQSYDRLGGNISIHEPNDILSKSSLVKLVFNDDGKIIALALYRDDLGGHKRYSSASNIKDPRYRDAVQAIIINDIEPYDNWYWVEASGKIEDYFKKHNGNPIPNHLVHKFLRKPKKDIVELCEDGAHYKRFLSSSDIEPTQKIIFGFKDKAMMDKVMSSIDNYGQFKIDVNSALNDLYEDEDVVSDDEKSLEAASIFIQELDEKHDEGFNEMLPSWKKQLKEAINRFLKEKRKKSISINEKAYVDANLNTAKLLIDKMPLLQSHQFKM